MSLHMEAMSEILALRSERDALQKAADANMALAETLDRTLAATLDERDEARAEVEAARKRCRDRLDYGEDETGLAQDILDAMDEAAR